MTFLANVGAMLASYLLMEGISAIAEKATGDPERDVQNALSQVQSQAQFSALQDYTRPTRVGEFMGQAFKGIHPERSITELAMLRRGLYDKVSDPETSPTLHYVTQRLGISPADFIQRTSPTRMGDMSTITRALPPRLMEQQNAAS